VPQQIDVGTSLGANAVLLIQALFDKNYCEISVDKMIAYAHTNGLEVLLETHTAEEFKKAIETDADLIGINNRNLSTLKIDLNTTKEILHKQPKAGKTVISESGIKTQTDLQFLRDSGADAFLIGSSIMSNENVELKVLEFVQA
jgi:indole-3-glycerol phosphate synthase